MCLRFLDFLSLFKIPRLENAFPCFQSEWEPCIPFTYQHISSRILLLNVSLQTWFSQLRHLRQAPAAGNNNKLHHSSDIHEQIYCLQCPQNVIYKLYQCLLIKIKKSEHIKKI